MHTKHPSLDACGPSSPLIGRPAILPRLPPDGGVQANHTEPQETVSKDPTPEALLAHTWAIRGRLEARSCP